MEYGVGVLGIPLIMVLGHTNCGAINAAIEAELSEAQLPGHLPELVKSIAPAVTAAKRRDPTDLLQAVTEDNVRWAVARLSTESEIIDGALDAGHVNVVGAIYDIASGKVRVLDAKNGDR
nr:carbonic anhydrase [Pelagibacterium limicola]